MRQNLFCLFPVLFFLHLYEPLFSTTNPSNSTHVVVDRRQTGPAGAQLALDGRVASLLLGGTRRKGRRGRGAPPLMSLLEHRRRFERLFVLFWFFETFGRFLVRVCSLSETENADDE